MHTNSNDPSDYPLKTVFKDKDVPFDNANEWKTYTDALGWTNDYTKFLEGKHVTPGTDTELERILYLQQKAETAEQRIRNAVNENVSATESKYTSQITGLEGRISTLNNDLVKKQADYNKLWADKNATEAQLKGAKDNLTLAQTQYNNLNDIYANLQKAYDDYKAGMDNLIAQRVTENLTGADQQHQVQIDSLNQQISAAQDNYNKLWADENATEAQRQAAAQDLANLQTQYNTLQTTSAQSLKNLETQLKQNFNNTLSNYINSGKLQQMGKTDLNYTKQAMDALGLGLYKLDTQAEVNDYAAKTGDIWVKDRFNDGKYVTIYKLPDQTGIGISVNPATGEIDETAIYSQQTINSIINKYGG